MPKSIDIEEFKRLLQSGKALNLLDVRRKNDYQSMPETIPGAVWRDPEKINEWAGELALSDPAVVYCVKGRMVSQTVADQLQQKGIDAAYLEGGIMQWLSSQPAGTTSQPLPKTIQQADIDLLHNAGVSEEDIRHSLKVAEKALEIAARTRRKLDMELVGRGALLHDLGKAKTHAIDHGRIGAEMGKTLGLPDTITAVMEKHIRGGLSPEEAKELGLPVKDYTLHTLEERIIIYADRLVDIITDGIVTVKDEREAETRFEEILQTIPKYGKNKKTLARYLRYHGEIQGLMRENSV